MPAQYFDDDKRYLKWVAKNPNGFVLNIGANNNPAYRVIHSARCYSVKKYQSDKPKGAFAERGYRKVCANSFPEIVEWIKKMAAGILERIVAKLAAILKRWNHCPSKYLRATKRSVIIQMMCNLQKQSRRVQRKPL